MPETSTCYSLVCGETVDGTVAKCPKCGGRMRTSRGIKGLGWALLLLGLFLFGMMTLLTWNMAPMLLHPGEPATGGGSYTGTAEQAQWILGLFGIIAVFGLGTMINGGYQITTGRRSRAITFATLALAAILLAIAWLSYRALR
jgi:hypothetical protein